MALTCTRAIINWRGLFIYYMYKKTLQIGWVRERELILKPINYYIVRLNFSLDPINIHIHTSVWIKFIRKIQTNLNCVCGVVQKVYKCVCVWHINKLIQKQLVVNIFEFCIFICGIFSIIYTKKYVCYGSNIFEISISNKFGHQCFNTLQEAGVKNN